MFGRYTIFISVKRCIKMFIERHFKSINIVTTRSLLIEFCKIQFCITKKCCSSLDGDRYFYTNDSSGRHTSLRCLHGKCWPYKVTQHIMYAPVGSEYLKSFYLSTGVYTRIIKIISFNDSPNIVNINYADLFRSSWEKTIHYIRLKQRDW